MNDTIGMLSSRGVHLGYWVDFNRILFSYCFLHNCESFLKLGQIGHSYKVG